MTELMQAHNEWANRPQDERFTSLIELADFKRRMRTGSSAHVISNRDLIVDYANDGLYLEMPNSNANVIKPNHWSFGQLSQLAGAPAKYLRGLPAPIISDCLNHGLQHREVEDIGVMNTSLDGMCGTLRSVNGPNYGRVWDSELADELVDMFGDGVSGDWKVPGEFGKDVVVTKDNTTLFAGDRDMFVFLADEHNRISVPHRRENSLRGSTGEMSRGFFAWNSEVGSKSLGAAFFLFDYVCCNRIVWGAEGFEEVRIRHSQGAPAKWLKEIQPTLVEYANASSVPITAAITAARGHRFGGEEVTTLLLTQGFGKGVVSKIQAAHFADENRPMESLWDVVVGTTAYARSIQNQDSRVAVERQAGDMLKLAA